MKKIAVLLLVAAASVLAASAQKFALVDMEYIFKNVPAYEMANEQLNQLSQRWQKEVEAVGKEAETMYQNYLSDKVFLTEEQVKKREEEIVAKEKSATELRYKYFGPEGELYQKRQTLLKPIQDDVYNAIKKVAEERGYQAIFDRASASDIIYASPRIHVSKEGLAQLGYLNLNQYLFKKAIKTEITKKTISKMVKKNLFPVAVALPLSAMAQKFGVVDIEAVFTAMPEYTAMQTQLQETSKKYEDEFMKLQEEVNKLYADYQTLEKDASTPDAIKERRLQEVQDRYAKVQQFRETAQQDISRQEQQLSTPIQQKLTDAIKAVGAEGGFSFIMPKDGLLLYQGNDVVDVTPQIRTKLGI